MINRSKFLPVLALAVVLTPLAAHARGDHAPAQNPAHQLYLAGTYSDQSTAIAHGRAAETNPSGNLVTVNAQSHFAGINSFADAK